MKDLVSGEGPSVRTGSGEAPAANGPIGGTTVDLCFDDGIGFDHRRGGYLRRSVVCRASDAGVVVEVSPREGAHVPWWTSVHLVVHDQPRTATARLDGQAVETVFDEARCALRVDIPERAAATTVEIFRSTRDGVRRGVGWVRASHRVRPPAGGGVSS